MHLVFLVHGLFGNPSHLESMQNSIDGLAAAKGSEIKVYRAQTVATMRSFDGIETNAERLYAELLEQMALVKPTHISIVGYSMGGVCVRYLVGMLFEDGVLDKVKPVVFATFATPHLGSLFTGGSLFGFLFNSFGPYMVGPSGYDLFRKSSVLRNLADPSKSYYKGLKRFQKLYLFANGISDRTVHFWTAYIADKNPFAQSDRAAVATYDSLPVIVDMACSRFRYAKDTPLTLKKVGSSFAFGFLITFFFVVLILFLLGTSTFAWIKHALGLASKSAKKHRHATMERVFGGAQRVLESAAPEDDDDMALNESMERRVEESVRAAESPGYAGFIDSCPVTINLPEDIKTDMNNLNALPWQKYALMLPVINTHSQIVDRRGGRGEGKLLMDFFATKVVDAKISSKSSSKNSSAEPVK